MSSLLTYTPSQPIYALSRTRQDARGWAYAPPPLVSFTRSAGRESAAFREVQAAAGVLGYRVLLAVSARRMGWPMDGQGKSLNSF